VKIPADPMDDLRVADQKGRITLGSKYAGKRFAVREEADGTAVLTPVVVTPDTEMPITSRRLAESFAALEMLIDNWDGRNSPAPAPVLIAYAREILAVLHAGALARGLRWTDPHIGSNERGQVTMEWWHGQRTLTIFVRSEHQVEYLKAWGPDIQHEMEDGELSRITDYLILSRWLYREESQAA